MDLRQDAIQLIEKLKSDGDGSVEYYDNMAGRGVISADLAYEIKHLLAVLEWFASKDDVEEDHLSLILDNLSSKIEEADAEIQKATTDLYEPIDIEELLPKIMDIRSSVIMVNIEKLASLCQKYLNEIAKLA